MRNFDNKKQEYIELNYRDVEDLIEEIYGHKIDYLLETESPNDVYNVFCKPSYKRSENYTPSPYDIEDMEFFKRTGRNVNLHLIFEDMINSQEIPDTKYLIEVSW